MEEAIRQKIKLIETSSNIKIISTPMKRPQYKSVITINIYPKDFDWNYPDDTTGFKLNPEKWLLFSNKCQKITKKVVVLIFTKVSEKDGMSSSLFESVLNLFLY